MYVCMYHCWNPSYCSPLLFIWHVDRNGRMGDEPRSRTGRHQCPHDERRATAATLAAERRNRHSGAPPDHNSGPTSRALSHSWLATVSRARRPSRSVSTVTLQCDDRVAGYISTHTSHSSEHHSHVNHMSHHHITFRAHSHTPGTSHTANAGPSSSAPNRSHDPRSLSEMGHIQPRLRQFGAGPTVMRHLMAHDQRPGSVLASLMSSFAICPSLAAKFLC